LKRAVVELGFLGGLVNDYQQSGDDNCILPPRLLFTFKLFHTFFN